jgi:hypothetical protein
MHYDRRGELHPTIRIFPLSLKNEGVRISFLPQRLESKPPWDVPMVSAGLLFWIAALYELPIPPYSFLLVLRTTPAHRPTRQDADPWYSTA